MINNLACNCCKLHVLNPEGGGVLTQNFGRYVPRQRGKWARAPERAPGRAWKCGAPERAWSVLSVKMRISGTAANPRRCRTLCVRAEPAVGGDERVEIKEILKMMVAGTAKSAKNVKWWCSGTDFWVICENYMLRNGNSGLKMGVSRAAHTQYAYIMEVPPPPPGIKLQNCYFSISLAGIFSSSLALLEHTVYLCITPGRKMSKVQF